MYYCVVCPRTGPRVHTGTPEGGCDRRCGLLALDMKPARVPATLADSTGGGGGRPLAAAAAALARAGPTVPPLALPTGDPDDAWPCAEGGMRRLPV